MTAGKVLVTGASGYVGAHVVLALLKKGYFVRGTVRSQKKVDELNKIFAQYKSHLEFVIVEDIAKENAYVGTLDGIVGVFHTASPFHFKGTNNKTDLLDPAINGTVSILKEAAKHPAIKKVVFTSSIAAVLDFEKLAKGHTFTEEDWSPFTYEQALTVDSVLGYLASKALAERAAWDFVKTNKPQFELSTICPPFIFGPYVHHIEKLSDLNESARTFFDNVNGKAIEAPFSDYFADVRDIANGHVLAYEKPEADGQRYLIGSGNFNWQMVVDYIHKTFPGQTKAQVGTPGAPFTPVTHVSVAKSIKDLGIQYHTIEQTFHDSVAQIIEEQKKGK